MISIQSNINLKINNSIMKYHYILIISFLFLLSINLVSAVGTSFNCNSNVLGLYACYKFNNDSSVGESYNGTGAKIYDYSGNQNNGTVISSPIYNSTGGMLNNGAFEFNGVSDYINIPNNDLFNSPNVTQQLTICTETKLNNNLSNTENGGSFSKGLGYGLYYFSDDMNFYIYNDTSTVVSKSVKSNQVLNTWVWTCGTYNGSCMKGYNNGKIDNYDTSCKYIKQITNSTSSGVIGREDKGPTSFLNGSVDEVLLFNRTLTDNEILNMYNTKIGLECNSTYLFDNCTISNYLQLKDNIIFSVNDTLGQAININANNTVLDCNGSTIIGNFTNYSIVITAGVQVGIYNNVTIKNCNISGYHYGIDLSNGDNNLIINNTLFENSYSGIRIKNSDYNIIQFNKIISTLEILSYSIIDNTTGETTWLTNTTGAGSSGIEFFNSKYNNLSWNSIYNSRYWGIWLRDLSYGNLITNTYTERNYFDICYQNSLGNNIYNWSANNASNFIYIFNHTQENVTNVFFNSTTDRDLAPFVINVANNSLYGYSSRGLNIINATFINNHPSAWGYGVYDIFGMKNLYLENVEFKKDWGTYRQYNALNVTWKNVSFDYLTYPYDFNNITNLNISFSKFNGRDWFRISKGNNVNIYNNTFYNFTRARDDYYVGLFLTETMNFKIFNNNLTEIGQTCVMFANSSNGIVYDNYCNTVNLSKWINHNGGANSSNPIGTFSVINLSNPDNNPHVIEAFDQREEPNTAFSFIQNYKHYSQIQAFRVSNIYRNYTEIYVHSNNRNITVYNNTLGSNVQVKARIQGGINISIDNNTLQNTWFRSFQSPSLMNRDDFYISNSFDYLSIVNKTFGIGDLLGYGSYYWIYNDLNFRIHKDYMQFIRGSSQNYITYGDYANLFNLSNSIIYYIQNNTLTKTSSLNQQLNYTLNLNGELYVFNWSNYSNYVWRNALIFYPNFTVQNGSYLINGLYNVKFNDSNNLTYAINNYILTETAKPNDPFGVTKLTTSKNNVTYHITSNITNNITIPLSFNVECKYLNGVSYIEKGKNITYPAYTCTNDNLIINELTLSYSNSSNELLLDIVTGQDCKTGLYIFGSVFLILPLIIMFLIIFLIMGFKNGTINLQEKNIIPVGISIIGFILILIFGLIITFGLFGGC